MIKTKSVYINAISILIVMSLLFTYYLPSEKALSSSASPALNASQPTTTNITSGSTNATNATGVLSENVTSSLGNATVALQNATVGLVNATKALQDISNVSAAPPVTTTTTTNATAVNTTKVINAIFDSNLPIIFILVILVIIIIPLSLDMWLAYHRKPTVSSSSSSSTDKGNGRALGMPGLYRSLMTFGVIVLVGTVIFYLLALITLNIDDSTSPVLQSLVDILKNLSTILGTALATIVAFYFGVRGSESATEKAAAATERAAAAATVATQKASAAATKAAADENAPSPKVLNTIPADGVTEVPLASLISATFSEQMSGPTINENTFTVRKEGMMPNPIKGNISLSPDGKTAIFDSEPDLDPNTKYTAEINEGAKDVAGNALVTVKRWSFSTTTSIT